jgi:hypothetical protein
MNIQFLTSQLTAQGPALAVFGVAFFLGIANLGRHPQPARLTVMGSLVLLITSFGSMFLQAFLVEARPAEFARQMQAIGSVSGFLRAAGLALLVSAIFAGREHSGGNDDRYYRD